jgi:hypothetical protein
MPSPVATSLTDWQSFYVIIGSSAAALTGLMFVVISLISDSRVQRTAEGGLAAFGTPTIVHLCAAFLVSAIASAPWRAPATATFAIGVTGLVGVAYVLLVTWRAFRQTDYRPVAEDWIWHTVLPFGAYVAFVVAATLPETSLTAALFATAGASIGLLFIGIHNAWDAVTYNALLKAQAAAQERAAEHPGGRHGPKGGR